MVITRIGAITLMYKTLNMLISLTDSTLLPQTFTHTTRICIHMHRTVAAE